MGFFTRNDKLSILQRQQETKIFEYVMEEINNNVRQQGIWGQAIVKSNGDEKKAEAEYIKLRVESIKDDIKLNNIFEDEKLNLIKAMSQEENKKPLQKEEEAKIYKQEKHPKIDNPYDEEEKEKIYKQHKYTKMDSIHSPFHKNNVYWEILHSPTNKKIIGYTFETEREIKECIDNTYE